MKLFVVIFILFSVLFSCKKKYTQREKNRIEELSTANIYKYKVPDVAFVFCLDTIKTDDEYEKLADEYCRRGQEVDSYLYLSSYNVYIPIKPLYACDDSYWYCNRGMNKLIFLVNRSRQWLVEDELIENFNQEKINSLICYYYLVKEKEKRLSSSIIHFDGHQIKDNKERDSLYVSFLEGYYSFIKTKKEETNIMIDSLVKKYPFNLTIGDYFLPPPIPAEK